MSTACASTVIRKAKAYLAQLYINSDQQCEPSQAQPQPRTYMAKLAMPYINIELQTEGTSGRHGRDHQSGISPRICNAKSVSVEAVYPQSGVSTAIGEAKSYLAQLYVNTDQQTKPPCW